MAPPANTSVRLPVSIIDKIRILAVEHERSIVAEIRIALVEYIRRSEEGEPT